MRPNHEHVIQLIHKVAAAVILPRFRNLGADDIAYKKLPSDVVTIADIEAEHRLTEALRAMDPGVVIVGEEAADADPAILAALGADAPVWLIDPIDGTGNFAQGKACFAVVVAYCLGGEILAGWVHDPVADETAWASRGKGAWIQDRSGTRRIHAAPPRRLSDMTGRLGYSVARRVRTWSGQGTASSPPRIVYYGSTGREYLDLSQGALDFAQYTRLKPWDHAAGVLIHREAGGFSGLVRNGAPYHPGPVILNETLLLAADVESWSALRALFMSAEMRGVT